MVQLLVAHGADVHSEDNRHVSCIMIAFRKAHVKVIKVLVRHVTQFPPDQDCLRYIATLTDKVTSRYSCRFSDDLVKLCIMIGQIGRVLRHGPGDWKTEKKKIVADDL